jgi:hypothetical protein
MKHWLGKLNMTKVTGAFRMTCITSLTKTIPFNGRHAGIRQASTFGLAILHCFRMLDMQDRHCFL